MSHAVWSALAAYVHFAGIILLGACLLAERLLFRRELTYRDARLLRTIDGVYGAAAGLVLVSGLLRVMYFGKGAEFYASNPLFWVKMAVFLSVALLSIYPTIVFLRWRPELTDGQVPAMTDPVAARVNRSLNLQCALLLLIPLLATLMARGIGAL